MQHALFHAPHVHSKAFACRRTEAHDWLAQHVGRSAGDNEPPSGAGSAASGSAPFLARLDGLSAASQ